MISFTGSTAVGARIFEAGGQTMKRLLLELGGKGACVVCHDADLAKAVDRARERVGLPLGPDLHRPDPRDRAPQRLRPLVAGLSAAAPNLVVGPPESPDTVVGPVISARHRDRVEEYIETGRRGGRDPSPSTAGAPRTSSRGSTSARRCSPTARTT